MTHQWRPECPPSLPETQPVLYDLIKDCYAGDAVARPNFISIADRLKATIDFDSSGAMLDVAVERCSAFKTRGNLQEEEELGLGSGSSQSDKPAVCAEEMVPIRISENNALKARVSELEDIIASFESCRQS